MDSKIMIVAVVAAVVVIASVGAVLVINNNNDKDSDSGGDDPKGITITNTDGTTTVIPKVAEKVVVMNVNSVEAVIDIGAASKVVGVSSTAYGRAEYKAELPEGVVNVGSSTSPSLDSVVSCNPDLVIGFSTMKIKNQEQLEKLGYPVIYLDCYNVYNDQIIKDITELGKALGADEGAKKFCDYFNGKMSQIKNIVSSISASERAAIDVYAEFSGTTYTNGYPAQCKGTSTDVLLKELGVNNVSKDQAYGSYVSKDFIAASGADYVIKIYDTTKADYNTQLSEVANRDCVSGLPAKTNDKIYMMNNQISYGPRMFVAYFGLCEILFPTQAAASGLSISSLLTDYNTTFDVAFNTTMPIVVHYGE